MRTSTRVCSEVNSAETAISGGDAVPPSVVASNFEFDAAKQALTIGFSESVVGVDTSDVQLQNTTTGATIPASANEIAGSSPIGECLRRGRGVPTPGPVTPQVALEGDR